MSSTNFFFSFFHPLFYPFFSFLHSKEMEPTPENDKIKEHLKSELKKLCGGFNGPVAVVTSGGTIVPLEKNMVRLLDNFR